MRFCNRCSLPVRLAIVAALCAAIVVPARQSRAQEPVTDQIKCFSTWDANYVYLGFKVDCPDVRATRKTPNADVAGDDLVEFYIETDNKHASAITPKCFSMAVTAAGGSQFRAGTDTGKLDPTPVYTFKYAATIQGTINNSDDVDMGYTVEMAVPWRLLGRGAPGSGDMMSFNVILRRAGTKSGEFVSLSPKVETEDDVLSPAKWSNIVFAPHTFGAATTSAEKILSAKYVVRSPLVDGVISDKEWHKNTSFAIDLQLPAGFVYEAKFPAQRTILAVYDYDYDFDTRRSAGSPASSGAPRLADLPVEGIGPWFAYDRTQWHKQQLIDMAGAGVNVVLPRYPADNDALNAFARRGLDCIVSALMEIRAEGKAYPTVGMLLGASARQPSNGAQPISLKDPGAVYAVIKDFYQRVPVEFRALAQAGKPRAGQPADVVFLDSARSPAEVDPGFIAYCNEAYERDFGRALVWIVPADLRSKLEGYDGVATLDAGQPSGTNQGPRISVGVVSPGFDTTALFGPSGSMTRSREGGGAYDADWASVMKANPHWVVCNSWTGFAEGSHLAASRQYGRKYVEATRDRVDSFLGNRDFDAHYLRFSVPRLIPPKSFAQAELVIRNIGNSPWRLSDGYALAYRWYKSGRYFGESKVRRPLEREVVPGDTIAVNIGVATVTAQGAEMPEGDCELRFELMRLSDNKWFSVLGDQPLMAPVSVGKPQEWDASYLDCSVPVMLAAARAYRGVVRVRNDGSQTWKRGLVKLGCKLYRVGAGLNEPVPIKPIAAQLARDCKPGEIAVFAVDVDLARADRKPLDLWSPGLDWSYQLRFDIHNGKQWLSELGARTLDRIVEIHANDYGPRIVDCDVPATLTASQECDVKVVLRNFGAQPWDRKRTRLGYHWYRDDGSELLWDGPTFPMKLDLQPGMPAVVNASVKAPDQDGRYTLAWDVQTDGKWLSTEPLRRGGDMLLVLVEVGPAGATPASEGGAK